MSMEIKSKHNVTIRPDKGYFKKVDSEELSQQLFINELTLSSLKVDVVQSNVIDTPRVRARLEWLEVRSKAIKGELKDRYHDPESRAAVAQAESIIERFRRLGRRV